MTGLSVAGLVGYAGAFGACCWLWLLAQAARHWRAIAMLEDQPLDLPSGGRWPTLAVLFAARNEETAVASAARSLLAQDYPGLEVIAVDDRSSDRTGAILDELARDDMRLRDEHVTALPPGWLGKTHALQRAAEATTADWLLLTDADVVFAPGALRRAIGLAERARLDLVVAAPDMLTETFGERVFLAPFLLLLAMKSPPWDVADRGKKAAVGAGAFNLVRAGAFRAIGGLERIALSVDDDLRLGQALKFAGYRLAVVNGQHAVSVRWQVGLGGLIRGLEKNFFGCLDYRLDQVVAVLLVLTLIGILPFAGLFVGPWWNRLTCAAGIAAFVLILAAGRRLNGVAWYHGLFLPLGAAALATALVRSVWLTYRRGGVSWRDHLYPLAALRAHVRRRNAWLRELWLSTR
jgi:hypothetical protein